MKEGVEQGHKTWDNRRLKRRTGDNRGSDHKARQDQAEQEAQANKVKEVRQAIH